MELTRFDLYRISSVIIGYLVLFGGFLGGVASMDSTSALAYELAPLECLYQYRYRYRPFTLGAPVPVQTGVTSTKILTTSINNQNQEVPLDLNGNAAVDVVVAGGSTVTVLLDYNNGQFGQVLTYNIGGTVQFIAAAQINPNTDSFTDLVIAVSTNVRVLFNQGSGAFGAVQQVFSTGNLKGMAVADFDLDQRVDIAFTELFLDPIFNLRVKKNNGSGVFSGNYVQGFTPLSPRALYAADINGDSKVDLINRNNTAGNATSINIFHNNSAANFSFTSAGADDYEFGATSGIVALDLNGGFLDIAGLADEENTIVPLINTDAPGGFFQMEESVSVGVEEVSKAISRANLDLANRADVLVANPLSRTVSVLRSNDSGELLPAVLYSTGAETPIDLATADIDRDGDLDVFVVNQGGGLTLLPNGRIVRVQVCFPSSAL